MVRETPSKEELRLLYIEGRKTQRQIGQIYGVSNTTVSLWFKEKGVKSRTASECRLNKDVVLPSKKELEELYIVERLSTIEISRIIGINASTVNNLLRKAGIPLRNNQSSHLGKNQIIPSKLELKRFYLIEKKNPSEISKIYQISQDVVRRLLNKYNISPRTSSESRSLNHPPEKELKIKYVVQGRTPREIAEEYTVSEETIRNWLKKNKVPLRNKSESRNMLADREKRPSNEKLENLYVKERKSLNYLINHFDVSYLTIQRWLTNAGIKIRGSYTREERIRKKPQKEILEKLCTKDTLQVVANQLGVSLITINRWRREYGLSAPSKRINSQGFLEILLEEGAAA